MMTKAGYSGSPQFKIVHGLPGLAQIIPSDPSLERRAHNKHGQQDRSLVAPVSGNIDGRIDVQGSHCRGAWFVNFVFGSRGGAERTGLSTISHWLWLHGSR